MARYRPVLTISINIFSTFLIPLLSFKNKSYSMRTRPTKAPGTCTWRAPQLSAASSDTCCWEGREPYVRQHRPDGRCQGMDNCRTRLVRNKNHKINLKPITTKWRLFYAQLHAHWCTSAALAPPGHVHRPLLYFSPSSLTLGTKVNNLFHMKRNMKENISALD